MLTRYVARTLGTERDVARLLLARTRAVHGIRFAPLAVLFVLATMRPIAAVVPTVVRRRFVLGFVSPMFNTAPGSLTYLTGDRKHLLDACEGMLKR